MGVLGMKKVFIACFMALCLCVCSCGSSNDQSLEERTSNKVDAVADDRVAEHLVDDIEALVLGPEIADELERIQGLYDSLSVDAQDDVTNYAAFEALRDDYQSALDAVQAAIDAIDGIGEVDENSMDAIDEAQALLDEVDPVFADMVTNADVLPQAREDCRQAISDKGVQETWALISAGKYQDAYNYAKDYLSEHQFDIGDQSALTEALQTAELYWAYELYEKDYVGYAQDILDDLEYDAVTDGISSYADALQARLDNYLATIEPANGSILAATISGGYPEMTIVSGNTPLLVKVEDYTDPSRYIYVYVRANSSTTFNVPDGYYVVKYATGSRYFGDKAEKPFGPDTSYRAANKIIELKTTQEGNYIYYSTVTLTLYAVAGGNLSTTTIDGF